MTYAREVTGNRGILIAFEGIDGSGKTTQLEDFARKAGNGSSLRRRKIEPTKEPWDIDRHKLGALVREHFLSGETKLIIEDPQLKSKALQTIFTVDRLVHWESCIRPNLLNNFDVVTDRYNSSTLAYAHAGGINMDYVRDLHKLMGIPDADLTVYLRVTPEEAGRRLAARGGKPEIFEKQEFQRRVFEGYEILAKQGNSNWIIINGEQRFEKVSEDIERSFKSVIAERGWLV